MFIRCKSLVGERNIEDFKPRVIKLKEIWVG